MYSVGYFFRGGGGRVVETVKNCCQEHRSCTRTHSYLKCTDCKLQQFLKSISTCRNCSSVAAQQSCKTFLVFPNKTVKKEIHKIHLEGGFFVAEVQYWVAFLTKSNPEQSWTSLGEMKILSPPGKSNLLPPRSPFLNVLSVDLFLIYHHLQ